MSCMFCNEESNIDLLDHKKICSICHEKAEIALINYDKTDEYFLCRECNTISEVEELGYTDGFCMVCKLCTESETKNGTTN